jgi:hypothetical protein
MRNINIIITLAAILVLGVAATLIEPALWALVLGVGVYLPEAVTAVE